MLFHTIQHTRKNGVHRKMKEKTYLPEGELIKTAENAAYLSDRSGLFRAAEEDVILEAPCVLCDSAGMNLLVRLPEGVRGIIPKTEACWQPGAAEIRDIAVITRVGKPVQFKIREIYTAADGKTTAILSRKAAQLACWENLLAGKVPGDLLAAKVTHLEPFGAFCDIGCGIIALLTVDRISVSRIAHPSDRFSPGELLTAVVSAKEESGRISLSCRELLGTWSENASAFRAGQTACGIVRSVEEYGVFVELAPNLAGLAERTEGVMPGDHCSVYIKSILPERMKVKLVLIDTWQSEEKMTVQYYIDAKKTPHLDRWQYSPEECRRVVETVFEAESLLREIPLV